jgi:CheY-like chemotaxis protein
MPPSTTRSPRILCIDDAAIELRVRKLLLSSVGYSVLTASSREEGLELFKSHSVDLVITDHFLSDKTGTEIAREMKDTKPEVPIFIVSATSEPCGGLEACDGFLSRAEGPEVLLRYIADLLGVAH